MFHSLLCYICTRFVFVHLSLYLSQGITELQGKVLPENWGQRGTNSFTWILPVVGVWCLDGFSHIWLRKWITEFNRQLDHLLKIKMSLIRIWLCFSQSSRTGLSFMIPHSHHEKKHYSKHPGEEVDEEGDRGWYDFFRIMFFFLTEQQQPIAAFSILGYKSP